MKTWLRLISVFWPYRRKLVLSFLFGIMAASLWGFELLLTFPITVMFGPYRTLENYVQHEMDATSRAIDSRASELAQLELKLEELPVLPFENGGRRRLGERVPVIESLGKIRLELDVSTTKLWLLSWVKSRIILNLPRDEFQMFAFLFSAILVVTFLKGASGYVQDLLAGSVVESVVIDLRKQLFRHVLRIDPQTIAREGPPALLSDLTYTLQNLGSGLGDLGGRIVREPLKAITCLAALFYLNWKLTLIFTLFMPILGLLVYGLGQRLKRAANRLLDSMSRLYKGLEETFHNSKVVIAFDRAGKHRRNFHRENKNFFRQAMRLVQIEAMGGPFAELLGMLAASAVLLPAAYLVLRETTSIWGISFAITPPKFPELALYYALLAGVLEPVRKFAKFYTTIRQSTAIAERIFARMDTDSLIQSPAQAQLLPPLNQKIQFSDIQFRYKTTASDRSDRGPVLNGLDLTINAGESIAVVGANGSGKSTLVNLLPRFCDPDRGQVLIDGINLKDARLRDIREQITLVTQETLLFDDTILQNIRYGKPDATDIEIRDAARRAHVLDFAEVLPDGLLTKVGEQGKQLSGGQRQRISIARAILRDSRILILDEPTAAIDAQSEQLIYNTLKEFTRSRTTILITHCLTPTVLEFLNRVVVLDMGKVVASGAHAELLAVCPVYQRLWEAQTQQIAA